MKNPFKPKRKPFFNLVKIVLKPFMKKIKIVNENELLENGSIYLCNHVGARGPMVLEFNLPIDFKFWGTHEMNEGYKSRWNYLYKIYFHQKKKIPKPVSFVLATVLAPLMGGIYKGLQLISTYNDHRLKTTIENSYSVIEKGQSIVVFPEDSSTGYHDVLSKYYAGFYIFAKQLFKKLDYNVKIYNMYYNKKKKVLLIDEFKTVKSLIDKNLSNDEIAEIFKNRANELFEKSKMVVS